MGSVKIIIIQLMIYLMGNGLLILIEMIISLLIGL